jgi:hypothetical protein
MRHTLRRILFNTRRCLFVVAAAAAIGATASAVPPNLNPGDTQYNPVLNGPYPFFSPNYVAGPLPSPNYGLVTTFDVPYNYNGTLNNSFFGFVKTSVYRYENVGNPADPLNNTLAFSYVFNNLTPPVPPNPPLTDIVRATINDPTNPWFNGLTNTPFTIFAAGADPNSGGHSTPINGFFGGWNNGLPFDITRSATDYGVSIEFNPLNSGTQLNSTPNDQSALIWFATNATRFGPTNVSFSDNGHVGTAEAYGPSLREIPRPEPSTLVLTIIGCGAGWFAVKRGRML